MPRAEKESKVREIAGELQGSQAAVLAGYRGLTVGEAAELRDALVEVETRFAVVKNSLAMLAVKEAGFEDLTAFFDGPTAVAFVKGDPVPAAKRLVEQARRFPVLEIRGGFAEGRVLSAEQIRELASLDSREVMLAKIAGLGKMQISRAAWMFQALQAKFLLLLQALKEKLPEEEGAAEELAEAEAASEQPAPEATAEGPAGEPAAEAAEAPGAEDHPDPEQPGGGGGEGEEPSEGPTEPPPSETTETEPAAEAAGEETQTDEGGS